MWDIPKYAQDDLFSPGTITPPSRRMAYTHVAAGVYVTAAVFSSFLLKDMLLIAVVGSQRSSYTLTCVCVWFWVGFFVWLGFFFRKMQERELLVQHSAVESGAHVLLRLCSLPKTLFQALGWPENLHFDSQLFVAWDYLGKLCQIPDSYSSGCPNSAK